VAYTQTDLDALDRAIATSELEVELDGKRVRYRSTSELINARKHISDVLATSQSSRRTVFRFGFSTQRGD
jgi:hypothetical protein